LGWLERYLKGGRISIFQANQAELITIVLYVAMEIVGESQAASLKGS